jgi:hypothetical protein
MFMKLKYTFRVLFIAVVMLVSVAGTVSAQPRIQDKNSIAWLASFNTIFLTKHVSLWAEYQWRREGLDFKNWQQSLARVGLQYHFKNSLILTAGYGYIESFPFGDYPAGPYKIPEHRFFEQAMWNNNLGRLQIVHRYRLEQRLVGKVNQKAADYAVDGYNYTNRVRYMLRMVYPINHKTSVDKTWYAVGFDELFIGFGSNVNQNIFDQNRIAGGLGYQFNKMLKIEACAYNQTVQQGSLVGGKQVYQYNTGLLVNAFFTKPARDKKTETPKP